MKHAPDVDLLVAFDVEDQVGVAPKRPESQICEPELVRIARGSRRRMACDMRVCLLELVDESQGDLRRGFGQLAIDCLLDIPVGEFPGDDDLHDLRVDVRPPILPRSVAK